MKFIVWTGSFKSNDFSWYVFKTQLIELRSSNATQTKIISDLERKTSKLETDISLFKAQNLDLKTKNSNLKSENSKLKDDLESQVLDFYFLPFELIKNVNF